jgi:pentatricopeptide repeat domain-containing protein 1
VIQEMQNSYLRPNERTYGIIINGFVMAGKIENALLLIEQMKTEGVPPNLAVFNILIKGYAEASQPDGIDKV